MTSAGAASDPGPTLPGARGHFRVLGPVRVDPFPRERYVRIYVPNQTGHPRPRPVLVMFDGQNVFDDAPSYAGGWHAHLAVDKLSVRRSAPIVVGVDHGNETRADELAAFGGTTDRFLDWAVREVVGFVRREYAVIEGPAGIAIAGSSLGGAAALYAHFRRPEIFGGAICMSPSFWVGRGAMFDIVGSQPVPWTSKIYLDCGGAEGGGRLAASVRRMGDTLAARGYGGDRLSLRIDPRAGHNERSWRRRLPGALRFFYPVGA